MARCPRFAAAGSPGSSSVSTKATKVMPRPSRISAANRRARNLTKGREGSGSRHPGLRSCLAADAGWINRPGRVVVGPGHALGRRHNLSRLDQREEGTIGVELALDLLEELTPGGVVRAGARLHAEGFQSRVGTFCPARAHSHELAREEHEVVVGVGV